MTRLEYMKKRELISTSDVDFSIKEKAIKELDDKFGISDSSTIARLQYEESKADLDGMDGE